MKVIKHVTHHLQPTMVRDAGHSRGDHSSGCRTTVRQTNQRPSRRQTHCQQPLREVFGIHQQFRPMLRPDCAASEANPDSENT